MRYRAALPGDRWDWYLDYPARGYIRRRLGRPRENLKRVRSWGDRLRGRRPEPIEEALTPGAAIEGWKP